MKRSFDLISDIQPYAIKAKKLAACTQHDRVRSHVDGQWHCIAYLDVYNITNHHKSSKAIHSYPDHDIRDMADACVYNFISSSSSTSKHNLINYDDIQRETSLHISISKPFILHSHEIDAFLNGLATSLSSYSRFSVDILPQYYLLPNDSHSRVFLCLDIGCGAMDVMKMTQAMDHELIKFQQEIYYKDPKFHISVASFKPPKGDINIIEDRIKHLSLEDFKSHKTADEHHINSYQHHNRDDIDNNDEDDDDSNDDIKHYVTIINADVDDGDDVNNSKVDTSNMIQALSSSIIKPIRILIDKVTLKIGHRIYAFDLHS